MRDQFKPGELSAEQMKELTDWLSRLCYEGRQVEGTSPAIDINTKPEYYDHERFLRAQKTINKRYTNVSLAASTGLMLLLQFDEILIPLLKTGKSRTVAALYDRYSATGKYIKRIYESPFMKPDSEGWRYITLVRSMHVRAHRLLNSSECENLRKPNCRVTDEHKYLWINQYDMVLTQFAFIGLFILRPEKCGTFCISENELSDIVYFWRLISHQFGIEERFNVFAYHDYMNKQYRLLELLLEHYKEKLATSRSSIGVDMSRGFLLSFEKFAKETSFNILDHHWAEVISLSGKGKLDPLEGLSERWKLFKFTLIFNYLTRSPLMMARLNKTYKKKFDKFCEKSEKIKGKLAKKYPNHLYELTQAQGLIERAAIERY